MRALSQSSESSGGGDAASTVATAGAGGAAAAGDGDSALLLAFVAERDVPCPQCGYNLRALKSTRCPECNQVLALAVQRVKRRGLWIAGLVGLVVVASPAALLALGTGQYVFIRGNRSLVPSFWAWLFVALLQLFPIVPWVWHRRWIQSRSMGMRLLLALAAWYWGVLAYLAIATWILRLFG